MTLLAALLLAQTADALTLSSLPEGTVLRVKTVEEKPRLVLEEAGKEEVIVKKPDDLKGHVQITTPAQAIEFVRLIRTPGVWPLLFEKPVLEIRRQPVLFPVPRSLYSDLRIYTLSGWDGIVNDKHWERLGLKEPEVTGGSGKDWSIRRPCLLGEKGKYKIGTLLERVSEEGRYVFSVDRPEDAPRGIGWQITKPAK